MSVTFGFYNSKEGDRRYDAIQMSSIFDGIIQDGILQHVGTAMVVKESEAMIINVGVGRAWFNHTWTLNDALLPLVVPQSEILLNRYDAVVLEVDSREAVRANDIKIIKGTPASNPTKPTMVKTNDRWQYPLAYIYVGAGITSIRQANITNCVGTSECPFVTAPLDKVEIDDLIAQWQDQWKEFYEKQTTDMEETNKFWKEQWSTWFLAQTEEIQSAYLTWEAQWNLWYSEHTADMEATSTYWKEKWEAWFNEYTSINTAEMADWKQKSETEFREWFDQLQALLDGNTAASLAKKLLELQEQVDILNQFSSNLENEYTVYQKLYDNEYRTYGDVLDSSDAPINCASIKGRGISQQRKRFEIHLHKYYQLYGNDGYILFGDFSKFYDNIIHEIAKRELLKLFNDDEFIDWLLTLIFKGFQIDVSYMSDEEYETCMIDTFNKLEYRNIPKEKLTGEKWMEKSVNIGDQLSQVIGIYYPYPIDNYVKYVRQQKFYGRYMDDWYIMNPSKEELENLLENVCKIAAELGIHINRKKTRIVKISSKYKFLQIKYTLTDTGKVIKRINPDRVTAMRRKLKKLAVKVENEEADYDNVENMFRGWMGGHYKLLSREQRKNLIQLYEDLFSKEITIVNKKLIVSDRSA